DEQNAFAFGDVVRAISDKMIRRHPHVFGDAKARSAGAVKGLWDDIKAKEKAAKGVSDTPRSILSDIPPAMPALTRAIKLQNKAAKVGFDWPSLAPVFDKLKEEIGELEEALSSASATATAPHTDSDPAPSHDAIKEEFGDMLFVMANIARHLHIDPEDALRGANQKFVRRFTHIEARLAARGVTPERSTLAEMDALWDEAKAIEKGT
ncbi:MAG: nucleoside triphosphate pyrophosphohydrolase, partial [Hyphomicrobium sp.]